MYGNKALRIQKRKLRQKLNSEDHKKRGQAVFNHLAMTELLNQVRDLGAFTVSYTHLTLPTSDLE